MRDRKRDLCPKCDGRMRKVQYSERTTKGGVWYEIMCTNCLFRMDVFSPKRAV